MNVARHHAEWMELVPHSGPFVSMTAMLRVFPQGLDRRDPEAARDLRRALEEWQVDPRAPGKNRSWVLHVLHNFLGWDPALLVEGQKIPSGLEARMAEFSETLRPDLTLVGPAGTPAAGKPHLLIQIFPTDQRLDKPQADKHWKASPTARMAELLRATNIPLGLLTNGEEWTLVFALRGETTGYAHWYTTLWIEEHITLSAFQSLFDQRRFFGVAENDTLLGMLHASLKDQTEVTTSLGNQVRDAVEVLIRAFDRIDQDLSGKFLNGVAEKSLYDAALTVMMRLVFLFSAEERGLLDLGKPLYDRNYAVSTLREQLQEVADQFGEEVLERRSDGWARLLAIFRAVHGGIKHQDLPIPEYEGSLFDPDRYPFLEGRASNTNWKSTVADPLPVNNRVVLHLLTSLQMLKMKIPGGGPAALRRLSFRSLDIEQIGHVYEGLLDYTAARATEPVIGLVGSKDIPIPSASLSDLERWNLQGGEVLAENLAEITKRTPATLKRAIKSTEYLDDHKLLIACHQDNALLTRLRPFASLIRKDSFDNPVVVFPQGVFLAKGVDRRSTGTHYTPKSLTEPIVQYTLEPLVYQGPSEGLAKEEWKLRSPKEILTLKVCDMAMGSGAFLVQTCRYLAERLVESWENVETVHQGEILITPEGEFSKGSSHERLIPNEPEERLSLARRLIVDRCLYGVDINPMAVEMAKLSLWLITVQRDRPFTFLDHALKCGDSLLGISSLKQIENFSLRLGEQQASFAMVGLTKVAEEAAEKRCILEALPSNDHSQIENKNRLHVEVEMATSRIKTLADALIAFELRALDGEEYEKQRTEYIDEVKDEMSKSLLAFQGYVQRLMCGRRTFHWPVEFPEIFQRGGFDAFTGNPPYMGGQKLTGVYGLPFREYLINHLANGMRGSADLCAYFLLRIDSLVQRRGLSGLVVTSAIAEGDSQDVGLGQLTKGGGTIIRSGTRQSWAGMANVTVTTVWLTKGDWNGQIFLNDVEVDGISASLAKVEGIQGKPQRLVCNSETSFQGCIILGQGFLLTSTQAETLIRQNQKNRDVILPYLIGGEINSSPNHTGQMWIINFFDWPLDRETAPIGYEGPVAADYPDCLQIIREKVKPDRDRNPRKVRRERWWHYAEKATGLYKAISGLKWSFAIATGATKYVAFAKVTPQTVFSHALAIIASDSYGVFACLSCSMHDAWARRHGSYNLLLLRYAPSDLYETFPFPDDTQLLRGIGEKYYEHRREVLLARQEGLTDTYNRFHSRDETSEDIALLRALHVEMDQAVTAAYGWSDLDLGHDFHETEQGLRYTISESARRTTLDDLLALNHKQHAEEVKTGLHEKKTKAKKSNGTAARKTKKAITDTQTEEMLTQLNLFSDTGDN